MAAVLPVFSPVCTLLGAWKPLALSCVTVKPAVLVGGAHMQRTGDQAVSGLHSSADGGGGGGGLGGSNATSTPVFRVLSRRGQAKTSRGCPRWTVCLCHLSFVPPTNKLYLGSLKTRLLKSQSTQFFQIKVSVLKTITFVCLFVCLFVLNLLRNSKAEH